jgi:hypothetical protein
MHSIPWPEKEHDLVYTVVEREERIRRAVHDVHAPPTESTEDAHQMLRRRHLVVHE